MDYAYNDVSRHALQLLASNKSTMPRARNKANPLKLYQEYGLGLTVARYQARVNETRQPFADHLQNRSH